MFDTYRYYHTLKEGGFSEPQAETLTSAFGHAIGERIATKSDLADVRSEMVALRGELKADIAALRADMNVGFQRVFIQVTGAVTLIFLLAEYIGRNIK